MIPADPEMSIRFEITDIGSLCWIHAALLIGGYSSDGGDEGGDDGDGGDGG